LEDGVGWMVGDEVGKMDGAVDGFGFLAQITPYLPFPAQQWQP